MPCVLMPTTQDHDQRVLGAAIESSHVSGLVCWYVCRDLNDTCRLMKMVHCVVTKYKHDTSKQLVVAHVEHQLAGRQPV
jgi:hypothetical protein